MKTLLNFRISCLAGALISLVLTQIPFFEGKGYLFSVHMVSHIILLLITAPLLVLSLPERPARGGGLLEGISRRLADVPWVNWLMGVGIMWLWHVPALFNYLLASEGPTGHGHLHFLSFMHTGSLLLAGALFCWPLAGPYRSHRLSPPEAILYLTTACIGCSLLGLLITFAPPGLYDAGILDCYVLKNGQSVIGTGISKEDQQIAGLIMWVPCCFLYLCGVIYLLRKWLGEETWKPHEFYRKTRSHA